MDLSGKIQSGSDIFWTVKQMANITSNMFSFIFLKEQLIIYGKKTKVETLSDVCTKNQNSKTVIKTIIDGGHLGKNIDQKEAISNAHNF